MLISNKSRSFTVQDFQNIPIKNKCKDNQLIDSCGVFMFNAKNYRNFTVQEINRYNSKYT